MSFSIVMYVERLGNRPWWIIPFAVANILLLLAWDKADATDKKIKELEREVDELSKAVGENKDEQKEY